MEPAGYMVALARALAQDWPGRLDVLYVSRGLTQAWANDARADVLPAGALAAALAVRRRIRATRPDLVQVAGWGHPCSISAIFAAFALGIPVVADHDTWRTASSGLRALARRAVIGEVFRRISCFAPGGARQACYLRDSGVAAQRIRTINMSVDVAAIRAFHAGDPDAGRGLRDRLGIAPDATVVLFVGRLVARKGLGDLLDAWGAVSAVEPGARLLIVGDGEERGRIEAAAAQDPSIRPLGRLGGDDVWRVYAAADLVAAPSRFEPWGLIVNEAMASGIPAIVTDAFGCVGDLARHEETALVVPAAAPDRLAQAMLRLMRDVALRRLLADGASRVIGDWTIEAEAARLASIWRDEIAERRK
jgi:glycosyltransferase involved in cell wall biosynthesis